jgi:hypothetical protein
LVSIHQPKPPTQKPWLHAEASKRELSKAYNIIMLS